MSYQGRSLDDLPLAAYSRGAVDDEPEEVFEQPHLSQQEAVALAMGIDAAPAPAAESAPGPDRGPAQPRLSAPRFSAPRLSLPTFALPKLPRIAWRRRPSVAAESPFQVTTQPAMAVAHAPAAPPQVTHGHAAPAPDGAPAPAPGAVRVSRPGFPNLGRLGDLGDVGAILRDPRTAVRDRRVLIGGVVGIGVVLLGANLLGGGAAGGLGPGASPTAPVVAASAAPGAATLKVSGRGDAQYVLTGSVGFGRPSDGQLVSTWSDATSGAAMGITGRVGSVTRTTSTELVLTVTVPVGGVPITFVSQAGECTVGMAEKVFSVTGGFVCPEITSEDGRITLKITGSYQT